MVFLHGNPTSSYLWRNVIPHLTPHARCIVPDLIGHGDSDKLDQPGPDSYTFAEHRRYLEGLLAQLDLGDAITFVVHDWGSALGFDWARRHCDRVVGIAYMEAIVQPMSWADFPGAARALFEALRSSAGEELFLKQNVFVEGILPAAISRQLTSREMDEYRRPFERDGEDRRPTLSWPRELPIDGEPEDVVEFVEGYAAWLAQSELPKLFVNADPGMVLTGPQRDFCRTWPNQTEVTVTGLHLIQEDSPEEIGRALAEWFTHTVQGHDVARHESTGEPVNTAQGGR